MKQANPSIQSETKAKSQSAPGSGKNGTKSFFGPVIQPKLAVNEPNDAFEQEADSVAEKVMRAPGKDTFFSPAPTSIQREENATAPPDNTGKVMTEGAGVVYDQLKENPAFEAWKEEQTTKLKYKLWDSQPTELKAGVIGFGLSSAGILGAAFASDKGFRTSTIDTLQDVNLALPLSLLPYSEYYGLSGFKYKLPSAQYAPYTFETEFSLGPFFELMREKWAMPKIDLDIGVDSTFSEKGGFSPVTGGNVKLKFGGGIINVTGFYNQALPPTPVLISNPNAGEPPTWLMRSLPSQLEENLPKGTGVFVTVDILRVPELFNSKKKEPKPEIKRKANDSSQTGLAAPPIVMDVLSSGKGSAIEPGARNFMEERFGQDFSQVRIHTDGQAAQSAKAINAKAYTSGNDIVFDKGQYEPAGDSGKSLLAHELAHVMQQSGGVHRKQGHANADETEVEAPEVAEIHSKLQDGNFGGAYLQLNDHLGSDLKKKKDWLHKHKEIRLLFLKRFPAAVVAEVYSAEELIAKSSVSAFAMIDCWYQTEDEKKLLYGQNLPLFDDIMNYISPYTGEPIKDVVGNLIKTISAKEYNSSFNNKEFHTIHLLAPTVERKFRFYKDKDELFKIVHKKFDPFTGIRKQTMEYLTDTNEVDREQALKIYDQLKVLDEEQRRAFLDAALFAGALELNKDAEAFYNKNFGKQYKALPHNWDSAIMPWNWGSWDAPFAERLTVDHVALMSSKLNYEDKETRKFGFDRGLDDETDKVKGKGAGKNESDADRLLLQMKDPANFKNPQRLTLLLSIAVRGGLEPRVTDEVIVPKSKAGDVTPALAGFFERNGFMPWDGFKYHADKAFVPDYTNGQTAYIVGQTLFGGDSGKVLGEQRGTFDLRDLQDTEENRGSLGGMRFGIWLNEGDDKYNDQWLEDQVKGHSGSETLSANLQATKGDARTGKIFASIKNDIKQANIYATTLPVDGLNYFGGGSLYRSGPGVLQGLVIHLSWTKDTSDPDNSVTLSLGIENIQLDNFELIAPKSTLAIGHIGMKGFRIELSQDQLPAAKGLFIGLLKNADFTLKALMGLLPNVLKLLPYAVMTMTEEFKGAKAHVYKDALGAIVQQDFSSLNTKLSFTSLEIKNLYDTTAGFLDDFSIEQKDKNNNLVTQQLIIKETSLWTIDAGQNIRRRIRAIDLKIRKEKIELIRVTKERKKLEPKDGVAIEDRKDLDLEDIEALEKRKAELINIAADKGVKYQNRDAEMNGVRKLYPIIRDLTAELEAQFTIARVGNPLYDPLNFKVMEAEKERLQKDLDYLNKQYFEDKKFAEGDDGGAERFEARQRNAEFEKKYKSFDVDLSLRGINLKGGSYVRDLINDSLKSMGFISPSLEGLENIKIGAVDSSFVASGKGAASKGNKPGVAIRRLQIPLITAPALSFKTDSFLLEAGSPKLQNVFASVVINFGPNPLDKDPNEQYKYKLESLWIGYATFNGLTLKMGKAEPLLDFHDIPVEVWGFHVHDFDPDKGNLNIKIRDVKAIGTYSDADEAKKTSQKIGFGIDTTKDNDTEEGKKNAIEVQYNKADESIVTKLNIPSAWLPSVDVKSPTMDISSIPGTQAVEVKNIRADVKVLLKKETSDPLSASKAERPVSVEINSLDIGEISAQGIKVVMREEVDITKADAKKKAANRKVQEVTLPKTDKVFIRNINVSGLRVTLGENETTLSAIKDKAAVKLGETDLGGSGYTEKNARGGVLKTIAVHKGKFDALTFGTNSTLGRNGREYSLKEFFKFFGSTRLEGLDASATYTEGKTSATVGIKGKKNQAISVEYGEPKDGGRGYYDIRLPLSRINVPALHIEQGDHILTIPKPADRAHISYLSDVDAKLRAYIEFGADEKISYDIYLQSLDIADLGVYGLEYHNKAKGIDIVFEKTSALHIPNVKAGGFRFSSSKGFDVFGKAGGWLTAAGGEQAIEASFESIQARLADGNFMAEKDAGRSALTMDIASLGFNMDKDGNMAIKLGAINGGFPKMKISQTDPVSGAKTVTTVSSIDKALGATSVEIKLGADKNNVIEALGLTAGGLKIVSTETKGKEVSTTTVNLAANALGAGSATVKLNADDTKEIEIKDFRGGKIKANIIHGNGAKTSKIDIDLPDADQVTIPVVNIKLDKAGLVRMTINRPTIRKFKLLMPDDVSGDYTSIFCDLSIEGEVEIGRGNFDKLTLAPPFDAMVARVPDDVAVTISNLQLEYKGTSVSEEKKKGLTPDQEKLIELEVARDAAYSKMIVTPEDKPKNYGGGRGVTVTVKDPDGVKAKEDYLAAKAAYDAQRAKIVDPAKAAARSSIPAKLLEGVNGNIDAKLKIFNTQLALNVKTIDNENYVEIPDSLVQKLRPIMRSMLKTTFNMPFWRSEHIKNIGKSLLWSAYDLVPAVHNWFVMIANGNAFEVVDKIVEDMLMWPGILDTDKSLYGININIEGSWALDAFGPDSQGISLCEKQYEHLTQKNWVKLYGLIEYLKFVSPVLKSKAGKDDNIDFEKFKTEKAKTPAQIKAMSGSEGLAELVRYIKFSLMQEAEQLGNLLNANILDIEVAADVSLNPEGVINTLLQERKAGKFTFTKDKDIKGIHATGGSKTYVNPIVEANIGGGPSGTDNLEIPAGEYLSEDSSTKVNYSSIVVSPLSVNYQQDVYKLINQSLKVLGLRFGTKTKTKP